MIVHSRDQDSKADESWQLDIFRKGLKKRPPLKALKMPLKSGVPGER